MDGAGGNLFSAKTAQDLDLIQIVKRVSTQATSKESEIVAPPKSQVVGHVPQTEDKEYKKSYMSTNVSFKGKEN